MYRALRAAYNRAAFAFHFDVYLLSLVYLQGRAVCPPHGPLRFCRTRVHVARGSRLYCDAGFAARLSSVSTAPCLNTRRLALSRSHSTTPVSASRRTVDSANPVRRATAEALNSFTAETFLATSDSFG